MISLTRAKTTIETTAAFQDKRSKRLIILFFIVIIIFYFLFFIFYFLFFIFLSTHLPSASATRRSPTFKV